MYPNNKNLPGDDIHHFFGFYILHHVSDFSKRNDG